MRRKKKKRHQGETELNLAAMLDMAFQLLTFFILTFKPAPVEGEVQLRMPPPQPITGKGVAAGNQNTTDPVKGMETLKIGIGASRTGDLGTMAVEDANFGSLDLLEQHVRKGLVEQSFEQVVIQVDSNLKYEALMKVMDICTRQKLKDGSKLTKLSLVESGSQ
jgi:biopolymer transport protein ExbD